jgi:hypothetical protein
MKKYDENKVVRELTSNKVIKIEKSVNALGNTTKWITAEKGTLIGIRRRGKIDFLTHYCGYKFRWAEPKIKVVSEIMN